MEENLKQYLMNCDIEDLNEETEAMYKQIAQIRQTSEQYWRDRIAAENA
jgi:hypothetical protein